MRSLTFITDHCETITAIGKAANGDYTVWRQMSIETAESLVAQIDELKQAIEQAKIVRRENAARRIRDAKTEISQLEKLL